MGSNSSHTRGPWFKMGGACGRISICRNDEGKNVFGGGTNHKFIGQAYTEADADLMCAGEDMLDALVCAVDALRFHCDPSEGLDSGAYMDLLEQCDAAIAKARGD